MNTYRDATIKLEGTDLEENLNSLTHRLTARNRTIESLNVKINNALPRDKRDADYDRAYDYEEKIQACLQHVATRQKWLQETRNAEKSAKAAKEAADAAAINCRERQRSF